MLELFLVGIGTGNPDHLTREAENAIRNADLVLLPHKEANKAELAQVRLTMLQQLGVGDERIAHFEMPQRRQQGDDYGQQVDEWHDAIARRWQASLSAHLPAGTGRVALLVWGDPALYDSTLRIAARLGLAAAQVRVVPGISSMQVLCSAHGIALNEIGAPFLVTTGRQLRDQGWPECIGTLVVMLDGQCSYEQVHLPDVEIYWGAYLGMPQQILLHGRLPQAAAEISARRAQARQEHGWIMDIYLLRRPGTGC
ncbi:precorrin-6A synthase (deacetylating) [Comamonas endophytica]|uniref:Precorrin-6A synthase (Deacetylating) n=1 Tax=Comamonas endophytica TaxID=2949090 RepID=A0ABY6G7E6_9BURK|nr:MULTISPECIES: precorrin-6A synthase (deacetylating) [unclassified Acidovorax]MCD2511447.1 precorrin-6A synthase (deacetylating) [Acidovorax sp. D4N7]UYG50838.1 precorrin-6A synthase (deacetylating) [Acidovorax sp. 5MLIR]